jgi:hypothetical protein
MSEEALIKSSFLGGYSKRDVIQYMDSVLEEKDEKVSELEEKIAILTKENKMLNSQISANVDDLQAVPGVNYEAERDQLHKNKQIPFTMPLSNGAGNQEPLSVRQQMKLPEGSYQISKDQNVISMPEPLPIYQTKGETVFSDSAAQTQVNPLPQVSEKRAEPLYNKNMAAKLAAEEQAENIKFTKEKLGIISNESANINEVQNAPDSASASNEYHIAEEKKAADYTKSENSKMNSSLKQKFDVILEQMFTEELEKIQAELESVKDALENERQEKQALASKLEFSNELLLQLYKKQ